MTLRLCFRNEELNLLYSVDKLIQLLLLISGTIANNPTITNNTPVPPLLVGSVRKWTEYQCTTATPCACELTREACLGRLSYDSVQSGMANSQGT